MAAENLPDSIESLQYLGSTRVLTYSFTCQFCLLLACLDLRLCFRPRVCFLKVNFITLISHALSKSLNRTRQLEWTRLFPAMDRYGA